MINKNILNRAKTEAGIQPARAKMTREQMLKEISKLKFVETTEVASEPLKRPYKTK